MMDYVGFLKLEKHVEGGYFRRNYCSDMKVVPMAEGFSQQNFRYAGSAIYYLLDKEDFSTWHRMKSDEVWHYYDGGSPIAIHMITGEGELETKLVGHPLRHPGAEFQVVVRGGCIFAAELLDKSSFALIGCSVSPAFEYQDFELFDGALLALYPQHVEVIRRFLRNEVHA